MKKGFDEKHLTPSGDFWGKELTSTKLTQQVQLNLLRRLFTNLQIPRSERVELKDRSSGKSRPIEILSICDISGSHFLRFYGGANSERVLGYKVVSQGYKIVPHTPGNKLSQAVGKGFDLYAREGARSESVHTLVEILSDRIPDFSEEDIFWYIDPSGETNYGIRIGDEKSGVFLMNRAHVERTSAVGKVSYEPSTYLHGHVLFYGDWGDQIEGVD